MMAVVLTALMTITACITEDDDVIGDDDDGGNGGGGGGGVAGKRLKSVALTCSKPLNQGVVKSDYIYNSDGSLKRIDSYDASSKLISYSICTNNSDGIITKGVSYLADGTVIMESNNIYNSNKTIQKIIGNYYNNGVVSYTLITEYKYENGKLIREIIYQDEKELAYYSHNYNNNGRRTSTVYNIQYEGVLFTDTYTHSYNSDGTIQKTTHSLNFEDNTPVTITYTWENGKTFLNLDDFFIY